MGGVSKIYFFLGINCAHFIFFMGDEVLNALSTPLNYQQYTFYLNHPYSSLLFYDTLEFSHTSLCRDVSGRNSCVSSAKSGRHAYRFQRQLYS